MFKKMKAMPFDYEPEYRSKRPRKWPSITPEMHLKIRKLYLNRIDCSGEIGLFAKRVGLPRWKITKYAQRMGWIAKGKKAPHWSGHEMQILTNHAHHCPEVIRKHLKNAGYKRSLASIVLKRKRMRCLTNLKGQSARSLAICLGEDVHFVLRAINDGRLKATRRELNRKPQQGGNPYLIKDSDVKQFITNNLHSIDLRKVDKFWFVDVLTHG